MDSYNTIIFVDWGNTCDRNDSKALLDRLQELSYTDYSIYLATDGDAYDAEGYKTKLKDKGYAFFEGEIHADTFYQTKKEPFYWNKIKAKFGSNKNFILIDDLDKNIKMAKENSVHAILVDQCKDISVAINQLNLLINAKISPEQ